MARGNFDFEQIKASTVLPVANGGSGTAQPSLVAGANITITGEWPRQTIAATGGGAGAGTVTSVGLAMPPEFTVTGSPVTGAGTLTAAKANQAANLAYAGPVSGAAAPPSFRALVAADFPAGVVGGFQTPWLQNINAAGFSLTNTGSVGIGTAAPQNIFQVRGAADQNIGLRSFGGRASIGAFNDAGSAYAPLGFDANRFDFSGGNVGIGTTAPLNVFQVRAAADQNIGLRSFGGRASIGAFNDAGGAAVPLGFDATRFDFAGGNVDIAGHVTINVTDAAAALAVRGTAVDRSLALQTAAGLNRFILAVSGSAETGGNVGSDFAIRRYNDAGSQIDTPFSIQRSNGQVYINAILLASANPGAGTKQLWYDPADANRVKYAA